MSLLESLMPKGWTQMVDEAVTKLLREEILRVLAVKFPETQNTTGRNSEPGFDYAMRQYIEKRWTEIMKADPEIDNMIKEGLKNAIVKGFASRPE